MSAADLAAAVNAHACTAQGQGRCLVPAPIPWTQSVFLIILFIVGAALLGFYFKFLKHIGIWLIIVLIVLLLIIFVVAVVGFIPHCLVKPAPVP